MDINRIANGGLSIEPLKSKKVKDDEKTDASSREDRVELSARAISLFAASENKRFEEIQQKIDSGYYFQRDVTEKVVDAMLKDLKTP